MIIVLAVLGNTFLIPTSIFTLCFTLGCLVWSVESARVVKLRDDKGQIFLYSGALKNKKIPHGEGTAWYSTYKGGWANGLWHKKGMISFPGGAFFSGKFKNGKPVAGVLKNMKSESQKGKFKSLGKIISQMFGDCVETEIALKKVMVGKKKKGLFPILENGGTVGYFVGKVRKGSPHKKGTAYLVRYQGSWKNGKWNGVGSLFFPGGFVLKGTFANGVPVLSSLENSAEEQLFSGSMDSFEGRVMPPFCF